MQIAQINYEGSRWFLLAVWLPGTLNYASAKIVVLVQSTTQIFSSFSGSWESNTTTKGYYKWKWVKPNVVGQQERLWFWDKVIPGQWTLAVIVICEWKSSLD